MKIAKGNTGNNPKNNSKFTKNVTKDSNKQIKITKNSKIFTVKEKNNFLKKLDQIKKNNKGNVPFKKANHLFYNSIRSKYKDMDIKINVSLSDYMDKLMIDIKNENEEVHTFKNNIKVYTSYLTQNQKERYKKYNLHEPEEEGLMINMIKNMKENDCFLNVGAAIGYYTILARMLRKDIKVVGINPHPHFIEKMKKCVELNEVENIEIEESALCTKPNTNYYLGPKYGSCITEEESENSVLIKGKTIEEIIKERNLENSKLYIQMDIQGIEYDIISNFKQDTIDLINFILVGTHSEKIHTDCRDFLEKHNFDIIFDNWITDLQPDGIICAKKRNSSGLVQNKQADTQEEVEEENKQAGTQKEVEEENKQADTQKEVEEENKEADTQKEVEEENKQTGTQEKVEEENKKVLYGKNKNYKIYEAE